MQRRSAEHDGLVRSEKAAPPPADDSFEFVMSDGSVDRMGDVIEPDGWKLAQFKRNPIALFGHSSREPIGSWTNVRVEGGRLLGRLAFAKEGTSPFIDTLRSLVKQKILRAVSVGFRPIKYEKLDDDSSDWGGPFRFLEQELFECSLVSVPANQNALATAKAMHLPPALFAEIFSKSANENLGVVHVAQPARQPNALPTKVTTMKTRSERIEDARTQLVTLTDQLDALDQIEDRDEQQTADYESLPGQIEAVKRSLASMEAAEKALASRSAPPTPRAITVQPRPRQTTVEHPRDYLYKAATALFVAKMSNKTFDETLRDRYPDENIGMVLRAAVAPANTTVAGWAAELVQTAVADFLNQLPRSAIYPRVSSIGPRFTFGVNGVIRVPARSATPKVNGSFVGEGQPIPVRKMGLTAITLTPKKMAVISTYTREMAEHSTPSIESVIRQGMNDDTAEAIDTALIDNVAADTIRPAGLLNGLSTLTPAASGTQFEKMVADINTLMAPIAAARGGQSLVMLMNIAQLNKMSWAVAPNGTFVFSTVENGQVRNLTVVGSPTVPAARVIMLDASEFTSATGDSPNFNVSDVATIHEEDTTPLPISATGTPNTVAAPVRSLYQTDSIGVRMTLPMNWAMRRASMVTFMDGVTW